MLCVNLYLQPHYSRHYNRRKLKLLAAKLALRDTKRRTPEKRYWAERVERLTLAISNSAYSFSTPLKRGLFGWMDKHLSYSSRQFFLQLAFSREYTRGIAAETLGPQLVEFAEAVLEYPGHLTGSLHHDAHALYTFAASCCTHPTAQVKVRVGLPGDLRRRSMQELQYTSDRYI